MLRRGCGALAALALHVVAASSSSDGPSYVVQVHSTRDGFVLPAHSNGAWRTQLMATESGQQFECYLPPIAAPNQSIEGNEAQPQDGETQESRAVAAARTAMIRFRPHCVSYTLPDDAWTYEVCPGLIVRRVRDQDTSSKPQHASKKKKIEEIGEYTTDGMAAILQYDQPVDEFVQRRLQMQLNAVYTQTFRARSRSATKSDIKVQFVCAPQAQQEARLIAVHQAPTDSLPVAFAISSRVFCDPSQVPVGEEAFTVESLLRPLAEAHVCIKRNEGWWTYEFCFGHDIRQYHRDANGHVVSGFSLGAYDSDANTQLDASKQTLVSEYIDTTRDILRPAFVEAYAGGTHCEEIGVSQPRQSKVFFYCNPAGTSHHILSVKETQTCTYTIKIATPAVCEHPHFLKTAASNRDKPEILHCLPLEQDDAASATNAPAAAA